MDFNDKQAKALNDWIESQSNSIVVLNSTQNSYSKGVDFRYQWENTGVIHSVMFDCNGDMITNKNLGFK